MPATESVKVVVRVRPLNPDELARNCASAVQCDPALSQVTIRNPKSEDGTTFTFNAAFGEESGQQELYDRTAFPLVESVLQGYNGTIFAYGQTGCGKTYTMSGDPSNPGVIPNSFKHIFGAISDTDKSKCFLVRCSFMEIYNEEIRDLLHYDIKAKLDLKEGKEQSVFVKGLSMETVNSVIDLERLMETGTKHRTTKETMMNERSSRSHAIFTVYIEKSEESDGRQVIKAGKLNLVDLAGSERQKKTHALGDRLREAIEINLSLSALGNVISALVDGSSSHIPYRDSKLTRLLQDSLGGNTKTVMIAVVSPADYNVEESMSTLRYASRAKRIQNKPKVNEDPKDALLREYAEQIAKLKRMLAEHESGHPVIIEKIVERERIVEKYVPVPSLVDDSKHKEPRFEEFKRSPPREDVLPRKKAGGRISVGLEDDSDEDVKPPVPKTAVFGHKIQPKAAMIEDDSSDSDATGDTLKPKHAEVVNGGKQRQGVSATSREKEMESSIGLKQKEPGNEDCYGSDSFEDDQDSQAKTSTQKPGPSLRPQERVTIRELRRVSGGQSPVPPNPKPMLQRPTSKESDLPQENLWLRPASQAEERKTHGKRTISNEPASRDKQGRVDLIIRSSRSPAVRKPVKGLVDEDSRNQAVQSRTQYRQPSGVQLGIAEVGESSEDEDEQPKSDVLAFIKEKLITGGQLLEDSEQQRLRDYHRLQLQLQEQKERESHLQEMSRQQEEDLLLKEKQYQSLAEEVEEQRKVTKALRGKYKSAMNEIEDLSHERESEKEDLLDSIRAKDRELAFYHKLTSLLLAPGEVAVVKQKSKYDDEARDWVIPPFLVQQNKQTVFPKLPKRQAQEIMEKEIRTKSLLWSGDVVEEDSEEPDDSLKKYQWLNRAESKPVEMDNRPPTSGNRSRQIMSRHGRNQLLDPVSVDKAPSSTFPMSTSYDQSMHATPLSKKRTLKPQQGEVAVRIVKKTSDIS